MNIPHTPTLSTYLSIAFVIFLAIAQLVWLRNLLRKVSGALGFYKTPEELALISALSQHRVSQLDTNYLNAQKQQLKDEARNEILDRELRYEYLGPIDFQRVIQDRNLIFDYRKIEWKLWSKKDHAEDDKAFLFKMFVEMAVYRMALIKNKLWTRKNEYLWLRICPREILATAPRVFDLGGMDEQNEEAEERDATSVVRGLSAPFKRIGR